MTSSRPNAPRTRRAGITLMEMLVVLVIVGILAGITASRLDWARYRADSVARGLLADLSQAQRTAISLQADVRVTLLSPSRLRIHEDADNNGTIDTGERVLFTVPDHGYTIEQGTMPMLPAPAAGTAITTTVVFRRDGTASSSGTFYLRSPQADPTCRYCRAVEVTRATGRVNYFSLATQTWVRGS